MIGEVALATVALVGAGLFVRSFRNIAIDHPRFRCGARSLRPVLHRDRGLHRASRSSSSPYGSRSACSPPPESRRSAYTDFVPLSTTAGPWNYVHVEGYTPATGEIPTVEPRPGVARLLRHHADSPARRPRFQRARRSQGRARDDRQPGVRQAILPRTESLGAEGARLGQVVHRGRGGPRQQVFQSRGSHPPLISTGHFTSSTIPARSSTSWCGRAGQPQQAIPLLRRAVSETDPNAAHSMPFPSPNTPRSRLSGRRWPPT